MLKDYEYVKFDVLDEDWNEYEIEDGTKLRIKFVMIKILRKKTPMGFDFRFNSNNIIDTYSPKINEPSEKPYSPQELIDSIINPDIKFRQIKEVWNKYLIKSDKYEIMVKIVVTNIQKTNKFDAFGDPFYNIQAQPIFKVIPPRKH